ncbi:MAG: hypothetical protein AAGA90_08010 [Actinomycetota bacterium]
MNEALIAIISSGSVGAVVAGVVSVVRARSENRHQDANTMRVVQDVYGETIADLRKEMSKMRAQIDGLEADLRARDNRIRQLTTTLIEHRIPIPPEPS